MQTIVYIGGFELPDRNAAAQRVFNNARIFRALGYRVVLVGVSRARDLDGRLYPVDTCAGDIEAWEIGYPTSSGQWFDMIRADWPLRQLAVLGAVTTGEVEAVICYNHPAIAQMRIAHLARSWRAKAVADCTEWYGARPWTSPANAVKNLDVTLRMHWANKSMDGIITTSPFMTGFYQAASLPIVEIPTLIEAPLGPAASLPDDDQPTPLIAIASGIGPDSRAEDLYDRLDWILDLLGGVARQGGRFVLTIAGAERAHYLRMFPEHAGLLDQLEDRVRFLGRVPRKQVIDLLQQAAFALVLRRETRVTLAGFPTKYSEAVSFGTPVIINALPSVRAYHVEGSTGFTIDPEDRNTAVARLCELIAMNRRQIMLMKQYCRRCGSFAAASFEADVRRFMAQVGN